MHIEKLSLFNFKNYEDASLVFSDKVNCLVGANGSGKTNLLDAIYYLSLTKSAFNNIDTQNIQFGQQAFNVKGVFRKVDKSFEVSCGVQEGVKKVFKLSKKEYDKISEHIGKFPVVLIAPNDTDVIREGSEVRRKFFDTIMCQIDAGYLSDLQQYNQYLRQRNSLLKKSAQTGKLDEDLVRVYDEVILETGHRIYLSRSTFIEKYLEAFKAHYIKLSEGREEVMIKYRSDFGDENFRQIYLNNLKKDFLLERTTFGVHKDDFRLTIKSKPLKKFGSQGQQKTFIVAMKMAHFDIVKEDKGYKPILLLDDIFDKLDSHRIAQLVMMIADDSFGQIFITDAREERTKKILKELSIEANFYKVENGSVSKIE